MMEEVWEFDDNRQDHQANSDEKHDMTSSIVSSFSRALPILDELDEESFTNLSLTCRNLHNLCFFTKSVKIPLNCVVDVKPNEFFTWVGKKNHLYDKRTKYNDLSSAEIESIVKKKSPRRLSVQMIRFVGTVLNEESVSATRDFLTELGWKTVDRLWPLCPVHLFSDYLIKFAKDLGVKEFRCDYDIPDKAVSYFLNNMSYFYYNRVVPSDFFVQTKVPPRLHLMGDNHFSFDTFMGILEGWGNCDFDIDEWNLGSDFRLSHEDFIDTFISRFDSVHIELFQFPLPSTRPLLLLQPMNFPRYMLRSDGQILGLFYKKGKRKLLLRQMKSTHLRKKLPKLFPITDDRLFVSFYDNTMGFSL